MEELEKLSKEQLIEKYKELEQQYNDIDFEYGNMENDLADMQERNDLLEWEHIELKANAILDLELFKNKLHLYDLDTEELLNFIDDYMRLYNKE